MQSKNRVAIQPGGEPNQGGGSQTLPATPEYQMLRGRRPVLVPTSAKLFPGDEWQVRLVNVSVGGVSCECEAVPKVGSQIVLQVQGLGQIPALVRWSADQRFGARFNGRIDVPEKELIAKLLGLSRAKSPAETEPGCGTVASDRSESGPREKTADGGNWDFEIEQIHAYQLALLDQLEELTARPEPDQAPLADVRLKLVRATRERRDLMNMRVLPDLQKACSSKVTSIIARLRSKDEALLARSAKHIGAWSMAAILKDWRGYCAASAEMRACIRSQIAAEREAIYLSRRRPGA